MIRSAIALAALGCCTVAMAGVRQADGASGRLEFQAIQAGAKFTGAFRRFHVRLDFDPAKPSSGSLEVTVETASVDSQDAERDEILRGPDFFWSARYPQAAFHATRFEREGAGWRATGELEIRGVKGAVPVSFSFAPAGASAEMKGTAKLKRLHYGIGQGDWASTEWVGDDVDIRFELKLAPAS